MRNVLLLSIAIFVFNLNSIGQNVTYNTASNSWSGGFTSEPADGSTINGDFTIEGVSSRNRTLPANLTITGDINVTNGSNGVVTFPGTVNLQSDLNVTSGHVNFEVLNAAGDIVLSGNDETGFEQLLMTNSNKSFTISNGDCVFDNSSEVNSVVYNLNLDGGNLTASYPKNKLTVSGLNIPSSYSSDLSAIYFYTITLLNNNLVDQTLTLDYGSVYTVENSNNTSTIKELILNGSSAELGVKNASTLYLGDNPDADDATESQVNSLIVEGNLNIYKSSSLVANDNINISTSGYVTVYEGGVLDGYNATFESNGFIQIKADADYGQGLLMLPEIHTGTGNIEMSFMLNGGLSSGKYSNGSFWRNLSFPISSAIKDVEWGSTFNSQISTLYDAGDGVGIPTNPRNSYISYWDVATMSWIVPTSVDDDVQSQGPYQVWLSSGDVIKVTGPFATSNNMSFSLDYLNSGEIEWNMLANPTTCNLSILDILDTGGELNGDVDGNVAYIYREYANNRFGYRTIGRGGNYDKNSIPPGAAFWVSSNKVKNSSFAHARKSKSDANPLSKTNSLGNNILRIELNEGEINHDYVYFSFNEIEDGNFDAKSLNSYPTSSPKSYVVKDLDKLIHKEYSIADLGSNFKEDYFVIGTEQLNLSLQISDNTIDPSYKVLVYDRKENITHDLTSSEYNFTFDPSFDQSTASRFEIFISNEALSESNNDLQQIKLINNHDYLQVKAPSSINLKTYEVYSISGAVMMSNEFDNQNINIQNLKNGVYIVRLTDDVGNQKAIKFIK